MRALTLRSSGEQCVIATDQPLDVLTERNLSARGGVPGHLSGLFIHPDTHLRLRHNANAARPERHSSADTGRPTRTQWLPIDHLRRPHRLPYRDHGVSGRTRLTAQHVDQPGPLVPWPQRTPTALRVALAQVAPHRSAEMEREEDEVIALAAQTGSLGPITQFLETWAITVEIARFPAGAARLRTAEYTAQILDKDDPGGRPWPRSVPSTHPRGNLSRMSEWRWEYEPNGTHVVGGETPPPPAFLAEFEQRADETVRAASALHLDGTTCQGRATGCRRPTSQAACSAT